MKKIYLMSTMIISIVLAISISSCSNSSDDPVNPTSSADTPQASPLDKVESLLQVSSGIGSWDSAYLTKEGYFCYVSDIAKLAAKTKAESGDEEPQTDDNLAVISYTSKDGSQHATLTVNNNTNLPVQLFTDYETLNFVFLNDTVLEIVYDSNDNALGKMELTGSVAYNKSALLASSTYSNPLQRPLYYLTTLVNGVTINASSISSLVDTYRKTLTYEIKPAENDSVAVSQLDLPKNEAGDFEFATLAQTVSQDIIVKVSYTIAVWTGNAKFKVGGSSCTLDGSVICPSADFNKYGKYGIVIATDRSKLRIDDPDAKVEYGIQRDGETSYEIDFRGFKPNTTYYYAAFYQFHDSIPDHGGFKFKYGDPDANIYYAEPASFETGDNYLMVDVVMCIDYTGSMSGIINTVKNNAISFYDQFKARCDLAGIELRGMNSQVIGFQDINVDGDDWFRMSPVYSMPEQRSEFEAFVNDIYAMGGGDWAESGLEALDAAFSKTDWGFDDGYHRQVVILWSDAPYLIREDAEGNPITKGYTIDSEGNSVPTFYTDLTVDMMKNKWDAMPSGKRLILFAPSKSEHDGNYIDPNCGFWDEMDSWKNVIHEGYTSSSFSDFTYILDAIVGELASAKKFNLSKSMRGRNMIKITPRPNK